MESLSNVVGYLPDPTLIGILGANEHTKQATVPAATPGGGR
ncbi:hypothetical protein [Embleya sp. NPDC059237]